MKLIALTSLLLLSPAENVEKEAGYLGRTLPELQSEHGTWWNVQETPLRLEHFEGRPTLVVYTAVW